MFSHGIRWAALGAAGLLAASVGPNAFATSSTGQTIRIGADSSYYDYEQGGGEFNVVVFTGMTVPAMAPVAAVTGSYFQTFCIERSQGINTYDVMDWTLSGSINGTDPLSPATAYLYTQFWNGNLAAYDYTHPGPTTRARSAFQLQRAIWFLEDEIPSLDTVTDAQAITWVNEALNAHWADIGNVRVLTLTDVVLGARQDLLVMIAATPPAPGGGGRTPGFWSNKNGQKLITSGDLSMLNSECLRDGSGNDADFSTKSAFKTWLLNGNAVNMSYMLSVQFSAMKLNTAHGFVNSGALVTCATSVSSTGQISITNLLQKAHDALCTDGYTPSGDANRAAWEAIKNALDDANNNRNWVN